MERDAIRALVARMSSGESGSIHFLGAIQQRYGYRPAVAAQSHLNELPLSMRLQGGGRALGVSTRDTPLRGVKSIPLVAWITGSSLAVITDWPRKHIGHTPPRLDPGINPRIHF
jgi:hypothetical protein